MGYRAFGETTAVHARARGDKALERAAEDAREGQLADRDDAADVDARSSDPGRRAAAERGGAESAERRWPRRRWRALCRLGARARREVSRGEDRRETRRRRRFTSRAKSAFASAGEDRPSVAALLRGRRRPTEDGDEGGEGTIARGVRANAGTFVGAFAGASWGVAASSRRRCAAPVEISVDDERGGCAGGTARRCVARRRRGSCGSRGGTPARAATKAAVATLLDARVRLAAATSRAVAEEAASAAVFAAAEVASLHLLAMDGEWRGTGTGTRRVEGRNASTIPSRRRSRSTRRFPCPSFRRRDGGARALAVASRRVLRYSPRRTNG